MYMDNIERKAHWNRIYRTRKSDEVSWYQSTPTSSLSFLKQTGLPRSAKIIDIGGGDSLFVDHLLNLDYQDITVLDISENAIERARQRLGDKSNMVKWIIADVTEFTPSEKYDLWHDRATFHFLTSENEIELYLETLNASVKQTGSLVIGTFSDHGPEKCSGLDIKQYSEQTMTGLFNKCFHKERCILINHKTPSGANQNFIFCLFRSHEII